MFLPNFGVYTSIDRIQSKKSVFGEIIGYGQQLLDNGFLLFYVYLLNCLFRNLTSLYEKMEFHNQLRLKSI